MRTPIFRVLYFVGLLTLSQMGITFANEWLENSKGYQEAQQNFATQKKPMGVFIYTDWCPYCRKFNKILSSPAVEARMSKMIKVKVNPEAGKAEQMIADSYQVNAYPRFFLHLPGTDNVYLLRTSVPPELFIQQLDQLENSNKK